MDYLPIFMNLRGQRCLVVGGGAVAARKASLLLKAGAQVRVVAPRLTAVIQALESAITEVELIRVPFNPRHLDGCALVVAATDRQAVNRRVHALAVARGMPVNVVDQPALCSFIFPAIVDRAPLIIAVSSGGVAPVPEMLQAGVAVALGTDSALSNNTADLFAEMKTASLLHKAMRWDAGVLPAQRTLDLVTIDAARALGVSSTLGSIEVGKRADLAVVSLRRPHTTPFYPANVISHLVYSSRGSDVQATIVDGRVLMAGGVLRTVDEGTVIERAQETAKELLGA